MDTAPPKTCQLCGQHAANRVTKDRLGNECWYCGYCRRWHPDVIDTFLHAQRIFAAWRKRLASEQVTERNEP